MIPTGSIHLDVKNQLNEWLEQRFGALVECVRHKDPATFRAILDSTGEQLASALEAEFTAGFTGGKIAKVDDEPGFTGVPGLRKLN